MNDSDLTTMPQRAAQHVLSDPEAEAGDAPFNYSDHSRACIVSITFFGAT